MTAATITAPWRKSRRSVGNGACAEVASGPGTVLVRDSTNRGGAVIAVPRGAWGTFTARLKGGAR